MEDESERKRETGRKGERAVREGRGGRERKRERGEGE